MSALAAPFFNRGRFRLFAKSRAEYSSLAIDIVRGSTVIDMLGLLSLDYRKMLSWFDQPDRFSAADYQDVRNSGITVFHPAVGFVRGDIPAACLRDITGWNAFLAAHPDEFLKIVCAADAARAKAMGKIGIILGFQNSSHFRKLEDVDRFYGLGQRVSQLTYDDNRLGGGSTDPKDPGLTGYGAQILERMNRVGMAVDISHCSDRTTLDAIEASQTPVLVTHSNCRALVPGSARCKTDEAIRKLAAKGGVMGITLVRFFVSSAPRVGIEDVLNHIDHVAQIASVEHVGLGTDVDFRGRDHGAPHARRCDLDGVNYENKIFDIAEGLIRRNYSRPDIELILGGNFQRALSAIWAA